MKRALAGGVVALQAVACSRPSDPESTTPAPVDSAPEPAPIASTPVPAKDAFHGLALARVDHGRPPGPGEFPTIVVAAGSPPVLLDGVVAGSTETPLAAGDLRKIDPLYALLKERAHPDSGTPPARVRVAFDVTTSVLVVKSVLQTAGFAGFPDQELVASRSDGQRVVLPIGVIVPGERGEDPRAGTMGLVVREKGFTVAWREDDAITVRHDVGTLAEARDRARAVWTDRGRSAPVVAARPDVVLHVHDQATLRELVAALEALFDVAAAGTGAGTPAFDVRLAHHEDFGRHGPSTFDRALPPEEIQRVVRAARDRHGDCFFGRKGRVTVRMEIGKDGQVTSAEASEADVTKTVADCVVTSFKRLRFPPTSGGKLTVVYPIVFDPGP